jgi:hypothetical protein
MSKLNTSFSNLRIAKNINSFLINVNATNLLIKCVTTPNAMRRTFVRPKNSRVVNYVILVNGR